MLVDSTPSRPDVPQPADIKTMAVADATHLERYCRHACRRRSAGHGRVAFAAALLVGLARGTVEEPAMKETLRPGLSKTRRIVVDKDRTIGFMGEEGRVYGTPYMVMDIEQTCRQLILEHADPGEDSVGTEVSIMHLAPTLLGMTAEIAVTVSAVEGRRVAFDVAAKDELDQICAGTHGRFVVDKAKQVDRLKAKAAKRAGKTG
jgi:predicted thioesterase